MERVEVYTVEMADSQPTVYLEDIDPTCKSTPSKRERPDDDLQAKNSSTITPGPVKRQRTLGEMFPGPQGKTNAPLRSLKPSGGSTSSIMSDSATNASGLVKLNAISFSMTAYLESLSDEEKRLLQLECKVMGKSW